MSFLLQELMLNPHRITRLDNDRLGQLLAQARSSRLLASLALELERAGVYAELPFQIRRHFQSGLLIHEKQKHDLVFDCEKITQALDTIGERAVFLKGAAYLLAELPVSRGRLITDIDIFVPKKNIDLVEKTLIEFGWERGELDAYDDRYYRQWGHEIPPLTHRKRDATLDVHHNILPPTAGPDVNADLLFERLMEIKPGVFSLSWQDMVIHSATHLFHEGEFHHGLRDLWDLDRMLRDFPDRDSNFWDGLVLRARELNLLSSLFHGLTYSRYVFETPIPKGVLEDAGGRLKSLRRPVMDFMFLRAFRPDQPECRLAFSGVALYLLYIRSHYLRMPLYLLLPHLARKAWRKQLNKTQAIFAPDKVRQQSKST